MRRSGLRSRTRSFDRFAVALDGQVESRGSVPVCDRRSFDRPSQVRKQTRSPEYQNLFLDETRAAALSKLS